MREQLEGHELSYFLTAYAKNISRMYRLVLEQRTRKVSRWDFRYKKDSGRVRSAVFLPVMC